MTMRSWVLKSWPEVHWQLPAYSKRWPVFQHMGTDMRPDRDGDKQIVGDTVWAVRLDAHRVLGVAWEWVALRGHLPAVRDPNGFVTNGTFFDEYGHPLDELASIVRLNRVAHALPWQGMVARVIRGQAAEAATTQPQFVSIPDADLLRLCSPARAVPRTFGAKRAPTQASRASQVLPLTA